MSPVVDIRDVLLFLACVLYRLMQAGSRARVRGVNGRFLHRSFCTFVLEGISVVQCDAAPVDVRGGPCTSTTHGRIELYIFGPGEFSEAISFGCRPERQLMCTARALLPPPPPPCKRKPTIALYCKCFVLSCLFVRWHLLNVLMIKSRCQGVPA